MKPDEGASPIADAAGDASSRRPGDVRLLGAVLAGGRSRRFGRDKTAEPVGGVPMIERAVAALEPVCREVVVVSSRAGTPAGRWRRIPDLRPGEGPLAGIEAGLAEAVAADLDGALVLAADLPLVGPGTAARLVDALHDDAAVAAAREAQDGTPAFEPLFAVYRVTCLETVRRLLDEGRRDARALLMAVDGRRVDVGARASLNVNTPASLEEAEAELRGSADGEGRDV